MILAAALTVMIQWGSDLIEPPAWWLYLGTEKGGKDIFDSGRRTIPSIAVPVPAETDHIWIRLFYGQEGQWSSVDFIYQPGGTLVGRGPDGIFLMAR